MKIVILIMALFFVSNVQGQNSLSMKTKPTKLGMKYVRGDNSIIRAVNPGQESGENFVTIDANKVEEDEDPEIGLDSLIKQGFWTIKGQNEAELYFAKYSNFPNTSLQVDENGGIIGTEFLSTFWGAVKVSAGGSVSSDTARLQSFIGSGGNSFLKFTYPYYHLVGTDLMTHNFIMINANGFMPSLGKSLDKFTGGMMLSLESYNYIFPSNNVISAFVNFKIGLIGGSSDYYKTINFTGSGVIFNNQVGFGVVFANTYKFGVDLAWLLPKSGFQKPNKTSVSMQLVQNF